MRHIKYADLPYFIGLASMTIYIGAHRGLCTKVRQQISIKEVRNYSRLDACYHMVLADASKTPLSQTMTMIMSSESKHAMFIVMV